MSFTFYVFGEVLFFLRSKRFKKIWTKMCLILFSFPYVVYGGITVVWIYFVAPSFIIIFYLIIVNKESVRYYGLIILETDNKNNKYESERSRHKKKLCKKS